MPTPISRRTALASLAALPVATLLGCDKADRAQKAVSVAKTVVLRVAQKGFKLADLAVTIKDLVVEIAAIIDGRPETIISRITEEEAATLRGGGQLVIKGEDGTEIPVGFQLK
jgi:hypothetical protein